MSEKLPEYFGWLKRGTGGVWHLVCHGDTKDWVAEALQKLAPKKGHYSSVVLPAPETPYAEVSMRRKPKKGQVN